MKYFLHDSNAYNDEKITELFMNFGYEGLGLFYSLLEKLAFQEKPIKTIVLKKQLKVGKRLEKHWNFMEEIGLISSKNGETFNENILNFSENYQIKKEKNRKKISEWREKQQDEKSVTSYEPVRNSPKVKLNKVKLNKVKLNKEIRYPSLEEFTQYFIENGYSKELALRAWNGYKVAGWNDSSGKKILNWKQKAQHVWFKEKNKYENNPTGGRKYESIPASDHETDRLHPGSDN